MQHCGHQDIRGLAESLPGPGSGLHLSPRKERLSRHRRRGTPPSLPASYARDGCLSKAVPEPRQNPSLLQTSLLHSDANVCRFHQLTRLGGAASSSSSNTHPITNAPSLKLPAECKSHPAALGLGAWIRDFLVGNHFSLPWHPCACRWALWGREMACKEGVECRSPLQLLSKIAQSTPRRGKRALSGLPPPGQPPHFQQRPLAPPHTHTHCSRGLSAACPSSNSVEEPQKELSSPDSPLISNTGSPP